MPQESRREITVLFIDLVGSTELAERLDPEPLRAILDRYYHVCTRAISATGGSVEKFIGDAVMAVFGVPDTHEDDALRAVRAAQAVIAEVATLDTHLHETIGIRLRVHCGIASGQAVVVNRTGADVRVVGDVVNTAARLESAAAPGQVLVGQETARLVQAQVRLQEEPPLALKGKTGRVPAWRVDGGSPIRGDSQSLALVGREEELDQLEFALRRARRERRCCLVTVVGEAGIGKSRVVREFTESVAVQGMSVAWGSCPSYGADTTYRPLTEVLSGLDLEHALAEVADADLILRRLSGIRSAEASTGVEEVSWAFRRLVEALARDRPLILVLDDLQWAQDTLLDLIKELTSWLADVPVLIIALTRPELLRRRPVWGGGLVCSTTLEVVPLSARHVEELIGYAINRFDVLAQETTDLKERVAGHCEGNPLFAELMVEQQLLGGGESTPPTIRALIGARLNQLSDGDRGLLEHAAAAGSRFHTDQLELLGSLTAGTADVLQRLLRDRWIRRDESAGSYRFDQPLVRDVVYDLARKQARAGWHLILADRPGEDAAAHLEAACLLRREADPADPGLISLSDRATWALVRQGTAALRHKDFHTGTDLLERARTLVAPGHEGIRTIMVRLFDSKVTLGLNEEALEVTQWALNVSHEPETQDMARIQRRILNLREAGDTDEAPLDTSTGDDLVRCRFHHLESLRSLARAQVGDAELALRAAVEHARALADHYEEERILGALCELTQWSPTPVGEALAFCEAYLATVPDDRALAVPVLAATGRLRAMKGDLAGARRDLETALRHTDDLHLTFAGAAVEQSWGVVASLASDHSAACTHFGRGAATLRGMGLVTPALTLEVYAARAVLRQGLRTEAAARLCQVAPEAVDRHTRVTWLLLRAELEDAPDLARDAVRQLGGTDDPYLIGEVCFEAARTCGDIGLARRALEAFTTKGADLTAASVKQWLEEQQ